eukprot:gb/GECH01011801.1/.p1 GENE.gb/GECH01011801.1/~~gb/GECH01011801.1/.p1  ORF type:complete len:640 (+),score=183.42 gb/GECH01011801.1/:1-1920(+)
MAEHTQEAHVVFDEDDSEEEDIIEPPPPSPVKKPKKSSGNKKIDIRGMFQLISYGGLKSVSFILIGTLAAAVNGVVPLLFYLVMGNIIDTLALDTSAMQDRINTAALRMLLIAILAGLMNFVQQALVTPGSEILNSNIRRKFLASATMQEMGFFDANKTGGLLSNLTEETSNFSDGFGEKFAQFWQFIVQGVAGLILAFVYSWEMSLVVLATGPAIILSIIVQGVLSTYFQKKTTHAAEESTNIAEEVIASFKTVRAFAGEEKEVNRYTDALSSTKRISVYKGILQGFTVGAIFFIIWGVCALAFWYGGGLVADGDISIGDMIKVFGMMLFASLGFAQAMGSLQFFSKAISATSSLLRVINREPKITFKGGRTLESLHGDVSLKNIEFSYPTRAGKVLKGISVDIKAGETIALVGSSGSGKSTIISLLERFYEVDSGSIEIDGVDIRELDPMWLHRQLGIVTQEPTLFATDIETNIKYGVESASEEQVTSVAKASNAHDFIMNLRDQYHTVVGERGVSLSGGQKQRVAIARALLKDPRILLLDEATSALDTESEYLVQDALDRMMKGRTTLVIAHRLSTVKNADRILVIERGELVEMGTHDELLKIPDGHYQRLASRQMKYGATLKGLDDNNDDKKEDE